jgi:hypothetical protein
MRTMAPSDGTGGRRKRRRRQDKPAASARLVLDDDHANGDIGILSEDLFADLFPQFRPSEQQPQAPLLRDGGAWFGRLDST